MPEDGTTTGKKPNPRFYLKEPYSFLLTPHTMNKRQIMATKPGELLKDFYNQLLEIGLDFKILGAVVFGAARIHKERIKLVIGHEKKEEEKATVRRERRAFDYDPLETMVVRPALSDTAGRKDLFYEELLLSLQSERERKKRRTKQREKTQRERERRPRRRRIEAGGALVPFEYDIDLDAVEIEQIIEEIHQEILQHIEQIADKEVEFSKIVQSRLTPNADFETRNLERSRAFLSLLYLIRDQRVEAEQDIETLEIFVIPQKRKGKRKKKE